MLLFFLGFGAGIAISFGLFSLFLWWIAHHVELPR